MKYILPLLLSIFAVFAGQFPSTAPSVGWTFVDAVPPNIVRDPNLPQIIGARGTNLWIGTRLQRIWFTSPGSTTRTLAWDNSAASWPWGDSGMPMLVWHPTDPRRAFVFAGDVQYVTNGTTITTNLWDVLTELTVDPANPNRFLPGGRKILQVADRSQIHLGGAGLFGRDGYLYIGLSDEGGQGDPFRNSQRIDGSFFGAIMRIDVDGRPGNLPPNPHPAIQGQYLVPADNPWVGATNFNGVSVDPAKVRTEFYMLGVRNPNTMTMDPATGEIYVGDVGGILWESVRRVVKGGNGGWAAVEGVEPTTYPTGFPGIPRPPPGFTAPLWTYPHPGVAPGWDPAFQGNCVFVGPVLRGARWQELDGCLIVSDQSGPVWAFNLTTKAVTRIGNVPGGANSWCVDPVTGDLLAATYSNGGVGAIRRMVRSIPTTLPPTLSATGLFDNLTTLTPASAVEYEVAAPFFSDYAHKRRWALPSGKIQRLGERWESPAGSIWIKHFDVAGQRVETRVTVKTQDAAYGLSYRWRPNGSDADLVSPFGDDFTLPNGQPWHIPSWDECMRCHNALYGYTPGFRTSQINVNGQLEAMSAAGWFTEPVTNAASLPRLWPYDAPVPVATRFQSYLDANCSYCHQPGGQGRGLWDGRASTPLDLAGIVDGPVEDTIGLPESTARVIAPGSLENSVLYQRIAYHDAGGLPAFHMPPLATAKVNTEGANLIADFIRSLAPRTNWIIGAVGPASAPWSEFSQEDGRNTLPPGSASLLDDDFYTAGAYPAGFNGLTSPLAVEADEPITSWERALTLRDATNRIHFITSAGPATLTLGLNRGAAMTNGVFVVNPVHNIVVNHRDSSGATTSIAAYQVVSSPTLTIPFTATEGPQTIELVRVGLGWPTYSSAWMNFDYVRIQK